jgi:hypothetical protein
MNEQARKLYEQAQANYPTLKAQIEAQVVRWFWAAGGLGLFSLEPFYFEQNRFSKSKILKDAPEDSDNKYQYGVNEKDEIIVAHSYIGCEGDYYEEFYFREDSQIISYRFEYSEEKECDNVKIFIYKDGLLQYIYSAFEEHYSEETMYYEGNKLIRRETKGIDYYSNPIDNTLLYTYDVLGKLNSITNKTGYVYYQKKDKKISYKALSEKAAERYYALLVPTIKAYPIKEPLYCINLSFDYQNILPTRIGFGTESERQEWKKTYGERVDRFLWNTAEYAHTIDIEPNEEDAALFDLFNQETEMQEKSSAATKLLVACAKRLKEECASLGIPSTDDFVIVVGDEEEFFFKKV